MGNKTGWAFQLNWQKAVKTWTNPRVHAKRMIDRFIVLTRTATASANLIEA